MSVRYGFSASDIIKEGRITRKEIEGLRTWNQNNNIPPLTDEQLLLFLLACDRNQNAAENAITEYYRARFGFRELFCKRNLDNEELQQYMKVGQSMVLPVRTDSGYVIVYHGLQDPDYTKYNLEPAVKYLLMMVDSCCYDYPPTGLIIISDMLNVRLMHLTKLKLGLARALLRYTQEGSPVKLKAIHVMNAAWFYEKALALLRPFLHAEVLNMVQTHGADVNMEEFYEQIPKKCLPLEYGGDLPPLSVLYEEFIIKLRDMNMFFDAEELQRTRHFYE